MALEGRGDRCRTTELYTALIVALLVLSGCASEKPSTFAELGPEANTKGFGEQDLPDEHEGDFTFGIGDTVGVLVQNNPDLTISGSGSTARSR